MSTIVEWFADTVLGGERAETFRYANRVLQQTRYHRHETAMENVIALADDSHSETTIDRAHDGLFHTFRELLSDYGISVETGDHLDRLVRLYEILFDLENREDHEQLLDLLDETGSVEERFAAIIAFIEDENVEDHLTYIDRVEPDLLDKLETILKQQQDQANIDEPEAVDPSRFEPFWIFQRHYELVAMRNLLNKGFQLGYRYHFYLERLWTDGDEGPDRVALYYVASSLAGGERYDTLLEQAESRLSHYIEDMVHLQKVLKEIRAIHEELLTHEST